MTDRERLDKISEIATRSVLSAARMPRTVRQDLYLIVTLCGSSNEFLERNVEQFWTAIEAEEPRFQVILGDTLPTSSGVIMPAEAQP